MELNLHDNMHLNPKMWYIVHNIKVKLHGIYGEYVSTTAQNLNTHDETTNQVDPFALDLLRQMILVSPSQSL